MSMNRHSTEPPSFLDNLWDAVCDELQSLVAAGPRGTEHAEYDAAVVAMHHMRGRPRNVLVVLDADPQVAPLKKFVGWTPSLAVVPK